MERTTSRTGDMDQPSTREAPHVKITGSGAFPRHRKQHMDVEHINAVGNALADLTQRTAALRGYL